MSYNTTIPYTNGYYQSRIQSLTLSHSVRSSPIIFAPQASSDTSPPVIDLPDTIRIPVYTAQSYNLKDIITEASSYTLDVDDNALVDTNGDGVPDNDFALSGS